LNQVILICVNRRRIVAPRRRRTLERRELEPERPQRSVASFISFRLKIPA